MENAAVKFEAEVKTAAEALGLAGQRSSLAELKRRSEAEGFWDDSASAQEVMRSIAKLEKKLGPWEDLLKDSSDLAELSKLSDYQLDSELEKNLQQLRKRFADLKEQQRLSGPYDDHGVLLSLYAGAGGTDAQDWTQMLFRMYTRYFDKHGWKYTVVDESPGEEAGLKSVSLEVDGDDNIYGKLKSEEGVHRLVRLSPFNADSLRQTSFAKVEIAPKIDSPNEVTLDEKDLKVDVYRSGGHGGQSVNTTDSAVRVTHLPTGISVAIQNERSQLQNKETALRILRSRLIQLQLEQHTQTLADLKGPSQSAQWGNQIRSYVLQPYKQVKDLRSKYETSDVDAVLGGDLDTLIEAFIKRT